ncbi:MAG TPA: DUF4396 domain-containing protein [Terracidiphilus sp.]|jgi:hypothetical protein|nr:DUF4396 domain-containing protein [Terracidiphilus sp.]
MVPAWFEILAWSWIAICLASAVFMLVQTIRKPQMMWIMDVVWPITGLYMGPVAVYLYQKSLPVSTKKPMGPEMWSIMDRHKDDPPTSIQKSIAVFHCGAGCSIGDVIAELMAPALALTFAGEFGTKLIVDFVFAYLLGVAFQYFTIVPMRGLSFGKGLIAAVRADTISIALFEVGMFAWMAITYYWLFPSPHLKPNMAAFWFMMQIAMIAGFLTALPSSAWLIRKGWKEKMPQIDPNQMQAEMHGLQPSPGSHRAP